MFADYHVHTEFSDDSVYPMEDVVRDAIRMKLDEICITGMEFGVQMHTIPKFEALFKRYPFDFIILSVHQVEDKEFWTQDFQKGRTQKEYNERYYGEMLSLVKNYKNYSVLGHMDLIKRYDKAGDYPFENIRPIAEEILKLYRELGGEIITIGSDSHRPEHLGAYIRETEDLLKEMGFKWFCTYKEMEPTFYKL